MKISTLAKFLYKVNGVVNLLPNRVAIQLYSRGRCYFLQRFYTSRASQNFIPKRKWQRTLWGLNFQSPLMNASGMFKNGEAYELMLQQGAGGYLGGTSTYNPRNGNMRAGIYLPFLPLRQSHITLNYLGLPNLGDEILGKKIITYNKSDKCPIGWSVMRSPDYTESDSMLNLIKSLWLYHDNEQIDFIEVNESCPNIRLGIGDIAKRLEFIAVNFLNKRVRHLPVIVKLSNDLTRDMLEQLMATLIKFKFDGLTLGNTSTNYVAALEQLVQTERKLFQYFTRTFGGGIGGRFLKDRSLNLCAAAAKFKRYLNPDYEFNIIRSGGIDNLADIYDSDKVGVALNQWYTGYFDNYLNYGDELYKNLFSS